MYGDSLANMVTKVFLAWAISCKQFKKGSAPTLLDLIKRLLWPSQVQWD